MSKITFLRAGRGDCAVLQLDTPRGEAVIVIDGGKKKDGKDGYLKRFVDEQGIKTIDLMIVTHLHQDHFAGFWHLIDKVEVKSAVFPYGDIKLNPMVLERYGRYEFFQEYHQIYEWLMRTGAEIRQAGKMRGERLHFGEFTLECLYPYPGDNEIIRSSIKHLCSPGLTQEGAELFLARFRNLCNEQSSIWTLRRGKRDLALFSADCTVETMNKALQRRPVHPKVLKLSHHGIYPQYFDAEQIARIDPKFAVITISHPLKARAETESVPCLPKTCTPLFTCDGNVVIEL